MKVSSTVETTRYQCPVGEGKVEIEFALLREGGNSSAGVKNGDSEQSVRLAWRRSDGGFDPISSAELPVWGFMDVVEASAKKDFLLPEEAAILIKALSESIIRQTLVNADGL